MIVRCPSCGAEASLDVLLGHESAAAALNQALQALPVGALVVRYLALFRPDTRRLTWPRVNTLLADLLPAITSERIERDGRTHDAPLVAWAAAFDKVMQARDSGALRTPLKTHGYLFEIVIAEAARGHGVGLPAPAQPTGATAARALKPASAAARGIDKLQGRRQ